MQNKKIIENKKTIRLETKYKEKRFEEDIQCRYICLERCRIKDIIQGEEKKVLETLKSFSNSKELQTKTPHKLNKSDKLEKYYKMCKEYGTENLFSVDVGNRNSKYRMLYCLIEGGKVCKILALCTDETHR